MTSPDTAPEWAVVEEYTGKWKWTPRLRNREVVAACNLEEAVKWLNALAERGLMLEKSNYAIVNVKTGERIPWEIL